jgi:hypothetical protein
MRSTSWPPPRPKRSSRSKTSVSRATASVQILTQPTGSGGSTAGTTARSQDGLPWTTTDHGPGFDHCRGGCRQRGPLRRAAPDGLSWRDWRPPLGVRETLPRSLSALLAFGRLNMPDPDAPRTPPSVCLYAESPATAPASSSPRSPSASRRPRATPRATASSMAARTSGGRPAGSAIGRSRSIP